MNRKKNDPCQKYGIAINDYVLGEEMDIPPEELAEHLKQCPRCREDLLDWGKTYGVMRTEAYHQRPDVQQRKAELLEKIRHLVPVLSEDTREISEAAEKIYQCLKTNGKIAIPDLRARTYKNYPFWEAMGSLIDKGRARYIKDKTNQPTHAEPQPGA